MIKKIKSGEFTTGYTANEESFKGKTTCFLFQLSGPASSVSNDLIINNNEYFLCKYLIKQEDDGSNTFIWDSDDSDAIIDEVNLLSSTDVNKLTKNDLPRFTELCSEVETVEDVRKIYSALMKNHKKAEVYYKEFLESQADELWYLEAERPTRNSKVKVYPVSTEYFDDWEFESLLSQEEFYEKLKTIKTNETWTSVAFKTSDPIFRLIDKEYGIGY